GVAGQRRQRFGKGQPKCTGAEQKGGAEPDQNFRREEQQVHDAIMPVETLWKYYAAFSRCAESLVNRTLTRTLTGSLHFHRPAERACWPALWDRILRVRSG